MTLLPTPSTSAAPALGRYVAERLGLTWTTHQDPYALGLDALAGLAVRRNPKRAHLVVSTVLAKHVPARPSAVRAAGLLLAAQVAEVLGAPGPTLAGDVMTADVSALAVGAFDAAPVVIGFAETATGLGHLVADAFTEADYLHTTRRPDPYRSTAAGFDEEHSHAVAHHVQAPDGLLEGDRPLVLVDDELTTGTTALNIIVALHGRYPRSRYVVAALLDLRPTQARSAFAARARDLGISLDVVSLVDGELGLPDDVLARALPLQQQVSAAVPGRHAGTVRLWPSYWPATVPTGGRFGFSPADRPAFDAAVEAVATSLSGAVSGSVLVVGTEELIYAPVRLADRLDALPGVSAMAQSTTRSPVLPLDEEGYAVRRRLVFPSADDPSRESFLYNVLPPGSGLDGYDHVVVVTEDAPDACGPLLEALRPWAREGVHLVPLPSTIALPAAQGFGSYRPDEVTWLLTDLSGVELELPTEDREELIQGGRRYFEMLPVEYQPDPDYTALFHEALAEGARRLARAVGVVADLVLDRAPAEGPVLVSLARAGTPVGVLMRRWLAERRQVDAPHYTISIVRGGGIDEAALDYLLDRYRPEQLRFVDGWTGKGAIADELAIAVAGYVGRRPGAAGLDPELAVLADPGSCTTLYGTRDDFLIPSACLNSTVSGLVSRTVLRDDLIRPGMFHGAKHYAELADQDVSAVFLDAVSAAFAGVPATAGEQAAPTWEGRASLAALAEEFGITNLNLIKPGVGETTRVLLRRVPWKILVRPDRAADLGHVVLLAKARGVSVIERDDLAYSCVGLIKPLS